MALYDPLFRSREAKRDRVREPVNNASRFFNYFEYINKPEIIAHGLITIAHTY
jgi:hypothetical protein